MSDTKKIDVYFSKVPLNPAERKSTEKLSARVMFLKLFLPSIAAIICGVLMIYPSLKDNQKNFGFDVTIPKKNELEKLHIENTKFTMTDADNLISSFFADNIDETAPRSKIIKLVNPKGTIPLKNGDFAEIHSTSGFYDQGNNILNMLEKVFINYNNETSVQTSNITYNFNTKKGEGKSKIEADGIYGKLNGDKYKFDVNKEIYTLLHDSFIEFKRKPNNVYIKAKDYVTVYKQEQKVVAAGQAWVKEGMNELFADKIVLFYQQNDKQPEMKDLQAEGHVKLVSPKGTVYANRAKYNNKTGFIELFDNVKIEYNNNKLYGDYATTDLRTGVSRMVSKKSGSRVTGSFKKIKTLINERNSNGTKK